jgi:hypothetical protein
MRCDGDGDAETEPFHYVFLVWRLDGNNEGVYVEYCRF